MKYNKMNHYAIIKIKTKILKKAKKQIFRNYNLKNTKIYTGILCS